MGKVQHFNARSNRCSFLVFQEFLDVKSLAAAFAAYGPTLIESGVELKVPLSTQETPWISCHQSIEQHQQATNTFAVVVRWMGRGPGCCVITEVVNLNRVGSRLLAAGSSFSPPSTQTGTHWLKTTWPVRTTAGAHSPHSPFTKCR